MDPNSSLVWNLYVQLREEIGKMQELRARAGEFKITIVGTAIGFILARVSANPSEEQLLLIPAYAAVFFDFLIVSFTGAILRDGLYSRDTLEPQLRNSFEWPPYNLLWEEHLSTVPMRPVHSLLGTVGITTLATVPAAIALGNQTFLSIYTLLFAVLVALIAVVAVDHVRLNGQRQKTWPRK